VKQGIPFWTALHFVKLEDTVEKQDMWKLLMLSTLTDFAKFVPLRETFLLV
jgi:hypothetical protein